MSDGDDFLSSSPPSKTAPDPGSAMLHQSFDVLDQSTAYLDDGDTDQFLRGSDGDGSALRASAQNREEQALNFSWGKLCSPNERERIAAARQICKMLQASAVEDRGSLKANLPRIVRLVFECPFSDISKAFSELLETLRPELERRHIELPEAPKVSKFFRDSIIPIDTDQEPQRSIFREIFIQHGRVSHLDRILAWHPSYQEKTLESVNFLMRAPGPLPPHIRNYIAILAAARFKCSYLVHQQEEEFLVNGGDPTWLNGVENTDPKIKKLLEMNAMLAHQPWRLHKSMLTGLLKSNDDPSTKWSTAELVHAIVVMSTFRGLAGLVLGLGITTEIDVARHPGEVPTATTSPNVEPVELAEVDAATNSTMVELLREALKNIETTEAQPETSPEERRQLFDAAGFEPDQAATATPAQAADTTMWGDYYKYIGQYTIQHQDFDVRAKDYDVFHVDEYSWEEQGYELVQRYFSTAAQLLDTEFRTIYTLTYNRFNEQAVDTAPFRQSVWYYVHRIFGVLHDDYDYSQVNTFMNRHMKAWVKNMVCKPFDVTLADINLGYHLQPQEKCHIALLAIEARKQAELLYGLHAVMTLMSA